MQKIKSLVKNLYKLLGRTFIGKRKEFDYDILKEEAILSPGKTVVQNFISNKLAFCSLILFISILIFVNVFAIVNPIALDEKEETQQNISPGLNMLSVPKELEGNVKEISVGSKFSVGVDNDGKVYVWGKTKITNTIDLKKDMPSESEMGKIVSVSAGHDHILALNDKGKIIAWGNNRLQQCEIPAKLKREKVTKIQAGYQISYALTKDGEIKYFGNTSVNDIKITEEKGNGSFVDFQKTNDSIIALKSDGTLSYLGGQEKDISNIPENLENVVKLASTNSTFSALTSNGEIVTWGKSKDVTRDTPEIDEKVIDIVGGNKHFTILTEGGKVYSYGYNNKGQINVPKKINNIKSIYSGSYQNYAVDDSGKVYTWGLKGYVFGTDDLGRDVFSRLFNGGRMTMTIGAISVIISTIIGIIIGGISGFFGGWVDLLLQRFTEVVSSLPFLPLAMILNSIIGNRLDETGRIILIMGILGILSWPGLARLIRAQVLAEREKEFVTAARALGIKKKNIIFKHIIPNIVSVIIVSATLDFAGCMLIESTLSFLGFGVRLPRPTWGNMLNGCVNSVVIETYWWRWLFPALMLAICVICINMVGDGLREAIDPKSNER